MNYQQLQTQQVNESQVNWNLCYSILQPVLPVLKLRKGVIIIMVKYNLNSKICLYNINVRPKSQNFLKRNETQIVFSQFFLQFILCTIKRHPFLQLMNLENFLWPVSGAFCQDKLSLLCSKHDLTRPQIPAY